MIWLALLMSQAPPDAALVKRGADIFAKTCAVAYCHGPEGGPGRAPRLAGRVFEPQALRQVVTNGVRNTSMPAFRTTLGEEGVNAVLAYLMSIGTPGSLGVPLSKPSKSRPESVEAGRGLFFDATRLPSCGTCHLLDGWGDSIGPDLVKARVADGASLARVHQTRVETAHPAGEEPFPAPLHGKSDDSVTVYDLSSPLPVLRSFRPSEVTLKTGSAWSHETATKSYTRQELESIWKYLQWLAKQ